jgi:hypothetical protein
METDKIKLFIIDNYSFNHISFQEIHNLLNVQKDRLIAIFCRLKEQRNSEKYVLDNFDEFERIGKEYITQDLLFSKSKSETISKRLKYKIKL